MTDTYKNVESLMYKKTYCIRHYAELETFNRVGEGLVSVAPVRRELVMFILIPNASGEVVK